MFNFFVVLKVINSISPAKAFHELLILIRGSKQSGKSSLAKRMTAKPFETEYQPTTITQTHQIPWSSKTNPEEKITITLLDVVSPNALLTSTAQGNPNGIIVMYDPRDQQSLQYAIDVIEQTPDNIPLCVLTNFQDIIPTDMHPKLDYLSHKFYHVSGSMKTNLGLVEIAQWLEYPRAQMRANVYQQLLTQSTREIQRLYELFSPGGPGEHYPLSNTFNGDIILNEPDAEGFWSSDDEVESPQEKRRKKHKRGDKKKKETTQSSHNPAVIRKKRPSIDVTVPKSQRRESLPPENEDDDLMNGIVEAARTAKGVKGKDEIDYDDLGRDDAFMDQSQYLSSQASEYAAISSPPPPSTRPQSQTASKSGRSGGHRGHKKHKSRIKTPNFTEITGSPLSTPIQMPSMERIASIQEQSGLLSPIRPQIQPQPQIQQFQQRPVQQQPVQPRTSPSGYDSL